jgi:hypothetical protein
LGTYIWGEWAWGGSDIRSMSCIRPICKCRCPPLHPSLLQPTHNIFLLSNLPGLIDAIILRGERREQWTKTQGLQCREEEPKNWFYAKFFFWEGGGDSTSYLFSLYRFIFLLAINYDNEHRKD